MKYSLLFVIFIISLIFSSEYKTFAIASEKSRHFDKQKINEFKNKRAFKYSQVKPDFWDQLKQRFYQWLWNFFRISKIPLSLNIIFWVVVALIMGFAILRLWGIDLIKIFSFKKNKNVNSFELTEENLQDVNFDDLINNAVQNQEWNKAIRYIYLYSLKYLEANNRIKIQLGKTNAEYLIELRKDPNISSSFLSLSQIFEYVWYGDFPSSQQVTDLSLNYLNQIKNSLN